LQPLNRKTATQKQQHRLPAQRTKERATTNFFPKNFVDSKTRRIFAVLFRQFFSSHAGFCEAHEFREKREAKHGSLIYWYTERNRNVVKVYSIPISGRTVEPQGGAAIPKDDN
jgi:hypothetical protein